jgi:predicted protein tyrosine phosphatase
MNPIQSRLWVCGSDKRDGMREVTHRIIIANPGASQDSFNGPHLQLWFGDVTSEADAKRCQTKAPSVEDVDAALSFFREAWAVAGSRILISCDYGASRSPALTYVLLADLLGSGRESAAFAQMLEISPEAVPNGMVVRLGDQILARHGALLKPLNDFYAKLTAELFPDASGR